MADFRSIDDALYEAAAAWHARLAGDACEEDWLGFTAWLEADAQHRLAFDAVSHASAEIDAQKALLAAALNAPVATTSNVVSLADLRIAQQSQARDTRLSRRLWMTGAVAVAASIAVVVLVQRPQITAPPVAKTWTTGIGERQTVKLEDGSEVQLNTDTMLSVSFAKGQRLARLEKGEAHFDVAHDAARPFTVEAGDRRVDVLGTAFNVVHADGKLTVTVARGIVQVSPQDKDSQGPKLTVGDQYRGQEGLPAYEVVKVDPATAMAWREGRLIFDNAPLSQVISDLNRYFERKLAVGSAETGNLRFSGVLKIDDEATVIKRLEGLLPVTVQDRGNTLVLERASSD